MSAMQSNAVNVVNPLGISGEASLEALLALSQANKDRRLQQQKMQFEQVERQRDRAMQQEQFQTELQARQQSEEADRQFQMSENDKSRGVTQQDLELRRSQLAAEAEARREEQIRQETEDERRRIAEATAHELMISQQEYDEITRKYDLAVDSGMVEEGQKLAQEMTAREQKMRDLEMKLGAFTTVNAFLEGLPEEALTSMTGDIEARSAAHQQRLATLTEDLKGGLVNFALLDGDTFNNLEPDLFDWGLAGAGDLLSGGEAMELGETFIAKQEYDKEKAVTGGLGQKALDQYAPLADAIAKSVHGGMPPGTVSKNLQVLLAAATAAQKEGTTPEQKSQWKQVIGQTLASLSGEAGPSAIDMGALAEAFRTLESQVTSGAAEEARFRGEALKAQQESEGSVKVQLNEGVGQLLSKAVQFIKYTPNKEGKYYLAGSHVLPSVEPVEVMRMALPVALRTQGVEATIRALETEGLEDDIALFGEEAVKKTIASNWSSETRMKLADLLRGKALQAQQRFLDQTTQVGALDSELQEEAARTLAPTGSLPWSKTAERRDAMTKERQALQKEQDQAKLVGEPTLRARARMAVEDRMGGELKAARDRKTAVSRKGNEEAKNADRIARERRKK